MLVVKQIEEFAQYRTLCRPPSLKQSFFVEKKTLNLNEFKLKPGSKWTSKMTEKILDYLRLLVICSHFFNAARKRYSLTLLEKIKGIADSNRLEFFFTGA